MEFRLIQPLNESGFTKIEFNFAELKTQLTNSLEKYKNLVYTDEQIKEAKTDRAALNKFKEALNSKKIEIKNMCFAPYNNFESQVKELMALVDEPVKKIDEQVKKFEDEKAQKKKKELEQYFNENVGELKSIISFEKIFEPRWLNVTYAMKKCKSEMFTFLCAIEQEIKAIKDLKLSKDIELQVLNCYLLNFDIAEALAEKTKLEALKSNLSTLETKTDKSIKKDNKPVLNNNTTTSGGTEIDFATKYKVVFEVEATKEQLQMIKRFLQENNIKYGSVK